MNRKPLRVAIAGCGSIATTKHLPFWRELAMEDRVTIAAVCDLDRDRAQACKDAFGAEAAYTDYDTMLEDAKLDIVDVCTHNRLHSPFSIAALNGGCHVLVEKPMAMTAKEAADMVDTVHATGRKLMVAQHMRFEAHAEKLKAVIDTGELGNIYTARAYWLRRRGIPGWGKFHIADESLGGPLIDIGVHLMDLCLWLMGSPKPVAASGQVYRMFGDREDLVNAGWDIRYPRSEFDVEDFATALIRFENGVTMNAEFSWAANIPQETLGVHVLGDKAGVSTSPLGIYGAKHGTLTRTTFDWLPEQEGHRGEIRHFTECVEEDLPVRVQPEESLYIQKIIDAIYRSSEAGRELPIE